MKELLFLDVESSGAEEEDRLLQLAYKGKGVGTINELFNPGVPIKAGAKAVHHITEREVQDKPFFQNSMRHSSLLSLTGDYILVAHNAVFDRGMLAKHGVVFDDYICTLKVARHLDEGQFENHTLQYLRYFYDLDIDLGGLSPHDALADIIVLEQVFERLASEISTKYGFDEPEHTQAKMVEISKNPNLLKICQFKKHKGETWEDVCKNDPSYIRYFDDKDVDEDTRFTMNYWMNKR